MTQELEKTRKLMEEVDHQKAEIMKELAKSRLEIDNVKRQMLQQEIAYNIQQTDALTRLVRFSHYHSTRTNKSWK